MRLTDFRKPFVFLIFYQQLAIIGINGQGLTSAPTNIRVSGFGGHVARFAAGMSVTWKKPLHIHGRIKSYEVMYSKTDIPDNNHTISTGYPTLRARIIKLPHFTRYTIYVRARTNFGNGEWSSPHVFRTHQGTPTALCEVTKLYSPGPTTLYIQWKALDPQFRRGVLLNYMVLWIAVNDLQTLNYKYQLLPVSSRRFTIPGLRPFTSYYIGVIARNSAGFYITQAMTRQASLAVTQEDVPSRPPSNLTAQFLCSRYQLKISWIALPEKFRRGILRSYKVLLYQGESFYKDVNVTSKEVTSLVSIDECKNYTIVLAAVTTPGAGPNITSDAISSCSCGFTSAPINIRVSGFGGNVALFAAGFSVTWKKPLHIHGRIKSYEVMYSKTDKPDSNHTISTGYPTRRVRIAKLPHFTRYTIYVRAKTNFGNGEWSSPHLFRTHQGTTTALCEVTKLYSPSPTTLYIQWKALDPQFRRGILLSYMVLWLAVDDSQTLNYKHQLLPVSSRHYTIVGLRPFTLYYIGVIGRTIAGFYITPAMTRQASSAVTQEDVPSRPPSNLTAQFLCRRYQLKISWTALQEKYRRGILRSYKVLLYQGESLYKDVNVRSKKVTSLVSVDECRNYTIVLAAVTTPGAGPNTTADAISSCSCGWYRG